MKTNDDPNQETENTQPVTSKSVFNENALSARKKQHRLGIIALGVGAALFILVLTVALRLQPGQIPSALLCKPARDFTAHVFQGKDALPAESTDESNVLTLSRLQGAPIVLNFWASWCFSCRAEARDLEAYWQEIRKSGVIVLGIAVQDAEEDSQQFARMYGKQYPLASDNTGNASIEYGVTGVPETYIINSEGMVVKKFTGPVTRQDLQEVISNLKQVTDANCPKV